MAITMTDKDGSYQEFDTYSEFEQAMILMSRIGGNKVPQDLMDEVSAKYGDKEPKPFQVQIDGKNFESAISEKVREATRELAEALDETTKDRRSEPVQFEINGKVFEDLISSAAEPLGKDANGADLYEGDYVTGLVDNGYRNTDDTAVMEIVGAGESHFSEDVNIQVKIVGDWGRYNVISTEFIKLSDNLDEAKERFDELNGVELEDSLTEFRTGDIVRATEDVVGFGGQYVSCNAGELLEVQNGSSGAMCLVKNSWKIVYVSENLANIELVCRKEDRKDIEL